MAKGRKKHLERAYNIYVAAKVLIRKAIAIVGMISLGLDHRKTDLILN